MPYEELVRIAFEETHDIYRARATVEELGRRGAFAEEGGYAVDRLCNDYRTCLDSLSYEVLYSCDIAKANGWTARYVTYILKDLEGIGLAKRHPPVRGRAGWTRGDSDTETEDYELLVDTYGDRIEEFVSIGAKTSSQIAVELDVPYGTAVRILRRLKYRGRIGSARSFKKEVFWYSTPEAEADVGYQDQKRKEGIKKAHKIPRAKAFMLFSKEVSLNGRNPDFASYEDIESIVCEMLDRLGPLTEDVIMHELGRTRPVKKYLLDMWREGKIEIVRNEEGWTYSIPEKEDRFQSGQAVALIVALIVAACVHTSWLTIEPVESPSGVILDAENECEGYVNGFRELMRGRYAIAYVLSKNLRQFRGCSPEYVLGKITGEDNVTVHRSRIQTEDGELDIKVTVGTEEDIQSSSYSSKQKAVCCGAHVMSELAEEDAKVCSVWFEERSEPGTSGTVERGHVKTMIVDGESGESREIPVDVVIVHHEDFTRH